MKGVYMDTNDKIKEAITFCEGYKKFINLCKTERKSINEIERFLISNGYNRYVKGKIYTK